MHTELTTDQRDLMQAALVQRQKDLEQQIAQQLGGDSRSEHARDMLLQDGDDAPARDADREIDLARSDQEIAELRSVTEALGRIQSGHYGLCVDCEGPIPFERLQRHPQALRCVPCQSAREARGGQTAQRPTI